MPVFTNREGQSFRTEEPSEMVRLKAAGYTEGDSPAPTFEEQQFHPELHNVDEVLAYMEANPVEANRVVAEEKAGKRRKAIVGE